MRSETHKVTVVNELEELDNQRREELVVARRVVGEGETNGGDDSSTSVSRRSRKTSLEQGEVLGGVDDGELTETVGSNVASALVLGLAVLEQRVPETLRDGLERLGRAVDNDLQRVGRLSASDFVSRCHARSNAPPSRPATRGNASCRRPE